MCTTLLPKAVRDFKEVLGISDALLPNQNVKFRSDKDIFSSSNIFFLTVVIEVDKNRRHQTIIGWGGAFTDATGINIDLLPEEAQSNLVNAYFSSSGIEYSLCRVPMGATDFSFKPYTYMDLPNDTNLESFSLQPEDLLYKVS